MAECLLPHKVIVEILCRLPSKSLLRFRSVCKSWLSLIADPSFVSLHRRHSPSFLLLQYYRGHEAELIRFSLSHGDSVDTLSDYSSLPLPTLPSTIEGICYCHCHGLLCLSDGDSDFSSLIICNPSIRRFLSIPKPFSYSFSHLFNFAFAFDSKNRDYKIVRLASELEGYGDSSPTVEVYSMASGIWRTLPPNVAPVCVIESSAKNASFGIVNGLVHWVAVRNTEEPGRRYHFVLSFDLVNELFHEIALPENVSSLGNSIKVIGGCDEKPLTVYHCIDYSPCIGSIWVMEEYGVVESWNKIFHFDFTGSCLEAPEDLFCSPKCLCIMSNGEILLVAEEEYTGNLHLYLLEIERKRYHQLGGVDSVSVSYYAESLVLLNNIDAMVPY